MKTLLAAAAFMLLTTTAHAAPTDRCGMVDSYDGYLAVRAGPGTYYPAIVQLQNGQMIILTHQVGNWLHVRETAGPVGIDLDGWVYAPLVRPAIC